jgi:hypothetical protein
VAAYNPELRADQFEIYLGTQGPVPLPDLRSFFYQLERITKRRDYFHGTVQLALSAAQPGSLGLIFDIQRRFRSRALVLGRVARALVAEQRRGDPDFEERMLAAAERSAEAAERAAEAAETSADAAKRSAGAGERTAHLTEYLLYASAAAVLVPIVAQEIRSGDLAAPVVKIDQHFDLSEIRVESATNSKLIPDDELPDERMLAAIKSANQKERGQLLAVKEREDMEHLLRSHGRANLVGKLRSGDGRIHLRTRYGNEFEINVRRSHVPLNTDVFIIVERDGDGNLYPSFIEKIDPV